MKELLEFSGYASAIIIAFIGLGKLFLKLYYKNELDLQHAQHSDKLKESKLVEQAINRIESVTDLHSQKMHELKASIEKSYIRYDAQVDSIKALRDELKDITRELKNDIKGLSTIVVKITTDLAIIKSRRGG